MMISVIIPAYNEEDYIGRTVRAVSARGHAAVDEIIVIDGGSEDKTVQKAKESGASVFVSAQKGRAAQMNAGARRARGEVLYFLHADSIPPKDFDRKIRGALGRGADSGCFRLAFDRDHWLLDLYAWFSRFDINAFRFGDQSLFVKSRLFSGIDGYREDHLLMEDNEMVRRLDKCSSFVLMDDCVETSARSYQKAGMVKLQLVFILIYTLYFLGVEQRNLIKIREAVLR